MGIDENQELILRSKRMSKWLIIISLGSFVLIASYFVATSYYTKLDDAEKAELKYLSGIVNTLAKDIDGEVHQRIMDRYTEVDGISSTDQDEDYKRIHHQLRSVYEVNSLSSDIYTLVLKNPDDPNTLQDASFFGVTSGLTPYFKHDYTPPQILVDKYEVGAQIRAYHDDHGTWISAFAPISDSLGNVVAIVQVDKQFDEFIVAVRAEAIKEIIISVVIFLVIATLILIIIGRIINMLSNTRDELIKSYSEIHRTHEVITAFASNIKEGNLDVEMNHIDNEILAASLTSMQGDLKLAREKHEQSKWIAEGVDRLNNELNAHSQKPANLYPAIINELINFLGFEMGLLFVRIENEDSQFKIVSAAGIDESVLEKKIFKANEGLISKAVNKQEIIEINDIPGNYSYIVSGIGKAQPQRILMVPLVVNNEVEGILEFAGFHVFTDIEKEYLEKVSETIASTLMAIKNNVRTKRLLSETQSLNDDLKIKEATLQQKIEEINEANEELNKTRDEAIHARDEAERAAKAKSEFLANMSHELRTPLNGVIGYAQILMESTDISEVNREKVSVINNCGEHLLGLINNVLDFSKIEANKFELIEQEFELKSYLREIFEMFHFRIKEKNLNYQLEVPNDAPSYVVADKGKLRQCLINLVGNAMKFTDKGSITIIVEASSASAMTFYVKDTGVGIPEDKLEAVLDPFSQVNDPQRDKGGTGLGLAITKRFIEIMGGELFVESEQGKGSTFSFTIPIRLGSNTKKAIDLENGTLTGIKGDYKPKILVMDDNPVNVSLACEILERVGFKIDIAENGEIGLEKVAAFRPDLVLVDVRMPVMNGIEFTNNIRKSKEFKKLKLIAVTASATEQDKKMILKHGCNDFVPKPYRKNLLLKTIAKNLNIEYDRSLDHSTTMEVEQLETTETKAQIPDIAKLNSFITKDWLNKMQSQIEQGDVEAIKKVLKNMPEGSEEHMVALQNYIIYHLKEFELEEVEALLDRIEPSS